MRSCTDAKQRPARTIRPMGLLLALAGTILSGPWLSRAWPQASVPPKIQLADRPDAGLARARRAIEKLRIEVHAPTDQPLSRGQIRATWTLYRLWPQRYRPEVAKLLGREDLAHPPGQTETACLLLRCALATREDPQRLAERVEWLLDQQAANGGWGLGPDHPFSANDPNWTDVHSSLRVLEALDAATGSGLDVPQQAWTAGLAYLQAGRNEDGGWGLQPPRPAGLQLKAASHGSTTAGAVLALLAMEKHLPEQQAEEARKLIESGLEWISRRDRVDQHPGYVWGPNRLEHSRWLQRRARLNRLLGLGGNPMQDRLIGQLLAHQAPDGTFPDAAAKLPTYTLLQTTCLGAEALQNASAPVAFSCLTPKGQALPVALRKRLVKEVSSRLGQSVSLRCKDFSNPPSALIWVLTGNLDPAAAPDRLEELAKPIRQAFVRGHVLILLDRSDPLARTAQNVAEQLGYQPEPLSGRLRQEAPQGPQDVKTWTDQARTRLFILPEAPRPDASLLAGIVRWANDGRKLTLAGGRGGPDDDRQPPAPETTSIRVARVKHQACWNVAPLAFDRLRSILAHAQNLGLKQAPATDLARMPEADLLWLTTAEGMKISREQQTLLKQYLQNGGTLMIDTPAGNGRMIESMEAQLREMFGPESLAPLSQTDPLISGEFAGGAGSDLREMQWSPAAGEAPPPDAASILKGIRIGGRLAVVLTPHAILTALEAQPIPGRVGPAKEDARRLAANLALYVHHRAGRR